jgi:hypothetical protein
MPNLLLSPQRHAPWIPACAGMTHDEPLPVMPAKAGIQAAWGSGTMPDLLLSPQRRAPWIPACAGMTDDEPLPVMPAKAGIQAA